MLQAVKGDTQYAVEDLLCMWTTKASGIEVTAKKLKQS